MTERPTTLPAPRPRRVPLGLIPRGQRPLRRNRCSTPVPRPWRTSRRSARPTRGAASPSRRRFYEWHKTPCSRQPYFFRRADGARSVPGSTSSGATRPSPTANTPGSVRARSSPRPPAKTWPHPRRMPAILESDAFDAWLDPDAERRFSTPAPPAAGGTLARVAVIGAWATSQRRSQAHRRGSSGPRGAATLF